jgi:hypothetical protein
VRLEQLDAFLTQFGHRYRVEFRDHPVEQQPAEET